MQIGLYYQTVVHTINSKTFTIIALFIVFFRAASQLTEDISICMYFAVDYAIYDPTDYGKKWLDKLYQFLYDAVKVGM